MQQNRDSLYSRVRRHPSIARLPWTAPRTVDFQLLQVRAVERPRLRPSQDLSWCKVFVIPSEYTGFGIPVLKSFVAGCPVVASRACSTTGVRLFPWSRTIERTADDSRRLA